MFHQETSMFLIPLYCVIQVILPSFVATSFACLCFNLLIKSLGLEVFASCLRKIDFSVSKTHGGEELNTEYTCDGGDSVVY